MKKSKITLIERAEVMAVFLGSENNTYPEIERITGYPRHRVAKIIDDYYKKPKRSEN